jgi:hypothetical protein
MATTNKIADEFSWAISKITTRIIPIIQKSYDGLDMINLLMSLPIRPDFKEIDMDQVIENYKKNNGEKSEDNLKKDLSLGGYIRRDIDENDSNRMIVYIVFTKDIKETWDEYFNKIVYGPQSDSYITSIAFIYLHEALHILNRHYDFYLNRQYYKYVDKFQPNLNENEKAELLNMAFDYWINSFLIEEVASHSSIASYKDNPETFAGLYDQNLSHKNKTQPEIVEILAQKSKVNTTEIYDNDGNKIGEIRDVEINGRTTSTVYLEGQHQSEGKENKKDQTAKKSIGDTMGETQPLKEALDNVRNAILEKTKGSSSQKIFEDLGISYEVPLDWFKELKHSIFTIVQKQTNNYDQTWGKIKNKFRHVAKLPGKVYKEKMLIGVVSIDQSGSMSDDDLRKINYVVSQMAKKANKIIILKHDTDIVSEHTFTKNTFKDLDGFVAMRESCGGTSHSKVFKRLDEIMHEKEFKDKKMIYLSFSDNYSDIEECFSPTIFKNIIPYWIMTSGGRRLRNVTGMQISLENGLLT